MGGPSPRSSSFIDERDEAHPASRLHVPSLRTNTRLSHQFLRPLLVAYGRDQYSALADLCKQCLGHLARRRCEHDAVERRGLDPTRCAVRDLRVHASVAKIIEELARAATTSNCEQSHASSFSRL
jgi:hypothetical protein